MRHNRFARILKEQGFRISAEFALLRVMLQNGMDEMMQSLNPPPGMVAEYPSESKEMLLTLFSCLYIMEMSKRDPP